MDKKLETLYDLCDTVSKELESANEKINSAGGELSAGDLGYLDKLTHTMKSLQTTIAVIEAEHDGYSRGRSMRGNSYARRGRYSRDSFADEIEELMDKAPDEHTRRKFEKILSEMR
jgi:hypothetical protein